MVVSASDMRDVGEDEVLLCYGFVDEVLDGRVQIAIVVWSYDFLGKLGKQRGRNIMKR